MQTRICYTNDGVLEELIRKKKLIPHKVLPGEKFIKGERYYIGFYSKIYKVISTDYTNGILNGAYVKMNDNQFAWISTPLDMYCDYYITNDIYNICDINIINNKHIYSGAEIRYWFFMKNITVLNRKYSCFWKYIDPTNPGSIEDKYTYTISANIDENGNYYNPRLVKIITKENKLNIKAKEYWEKLEKRDSQKAIEKRKRNSPRG